MVRPKFYSKYTACASSEFQNSNEWRIYDLITRHFLACCSDDAHGEQTAITIEIGGERFVATGLIVQQQNFLKIYPFERW